MINYQVNPFNQKKVAKLMFQKHSTLLLLLCLGLCNLSVFAAQQHALVIGIDEYRNEVQLQGAVNDALLVKKALHDIEVQLPDERVLLNKQATRANVLNAWHHMIAQAKPGDTLIFTYSGHGGQEQEQHPPFDESDHFDETLVLHEGYLTDDELIDWFINADEFNILFIVDACHSGGLSKTYSCRRLRSVGQHQARSTVSYITTKGDENESPSHVTFISAAEHDNEKVCEHTFGNKVHGALSWFFAKALRGEADGYENETPNGQLERLELEEYLHANIHESTSGKQNPKLRSRGHPQKVLLSISRPLGGLTSKKHLLQMLSTQFEPVRIELREGNRLHKRGDKLHFSVAPADFSQGAYAMTLFNIDKNGQLQFLYPSKNNHLPFIWKFPHHLPALKINPPFGEDNLVAVLCHRPPIRLQKLLKESAPYLPEPTQIIAALHQQRCQVGQYAFFSIK